MFNMEEVPDPMEGEGHRFDESGDPIGPALLWLQDTVTTAILQARQKVLQTGLVLCVLGLLLWTSSFLYGTFYYSYMPLATYSTPVHYYYRADCDSSASILCSFPIANVSLLRSGKHQAMTYGQPYRISLELEMPESPDNQELGMFMVSMTCYSRGGQTVTSSLRSASQPRSASSSRFTMLRYRSDLLRVLRTLFFLPVYLSGAAEQRQLVEVELHSDYVDNSHQPSIGAVIGIHSHRVQIYSAHLYIHAHYTGIRYLLFNFPLMSAFVGVASNFAFLSVLLLFSYLQMFWRQFWSPLQTGMRSRLGRGFNGFQSQRKQSENIEYLKNDQDDIAETGHSVDPDTHQEALCIKPSDSNRKEESILRAFGGGMNIQHRRIQNETVGETILKEVVQSVGMSSGSEQEGLPDSTLSTHIGSCVIT